MNPSPRRVQRLCRILMLATLIGMGMRLTQRSFREADIPSTPMGRGDAYSERDLYEGVHWYTQYGAWASKFISFTQRHVFYFHYPSTSIALAHGLRLAGIKSYQALRIFPIFASLIGVWFVFLFFERLFGSPVGLATATLVGFFPALYDWSLMLFMHSYYMAVFLATNYVVFCKRELPRGRRCALMFVLGALQSLLGFDLVPYTAFLGLLSFFYPSGFRREEWRPSVSLWSGLSVGIAAIFLRNVWFVGSFAYAATEWRETLIRRIHKAVSPETAEVISIPWTTCLATHFDAARHYFYPQTHFVLFIAVAAGLTLLIFSPKDGVAKPPAGLSLVLWGQLAGSLIWYMLVRGHANHHPHIFPRHLTLFAGMVWGTLLWVLWSLGSHYIRYVGARFKRPACHAT